VYLGMPYRFFNADEAADYLRLSRAEHRVEEAQSIRRFSTTAGSDIRW